MPIDVEQSLQICAAATAGPWWRTDPPWGDGTSVHAGPSDDPHTAVKVVCEFDPFDVQFSPRYDEVDSDKIVEFDRVTDDMAFIAHAREGYPAALRRVQELESKLSKAVRYIAALRAYPASMGHDPVLNQEQHDAALEFYSDTTHATS